MPVLTVYLSGSLTRGHPLPEVQDSQIKELDKWLSRQTFDPDTIYETCLAAEQEQHFGDVLRKYDFVRVCLTRNPNTGNRIAVYIRQPNIDL